MVSVLVARGELQISLKLLEAKQQGNCKVIHGPKNKNKPGIQKKHMFS